MRDALSKFLIQSTSVALARSSTIPKSSSTRPRASYTTAFPFYTSLSLSPIIVSRAIDQTLLLPCAHACTPTLSTPRAALEALSNEKCRPADFQVQRMCTYIHTYALAFFFFFRLCPLPLSLSLSLSLSLPLLFINPHTGTCALYKVAKDKRGATTVFRSPRKGAKARGLIFSNFCQCVCV